MEIKIIINLVTKKYGATYVDKLTEFDSDKFDADQYDNTELHVIKITKDEEYHSIYNIKDLKKHDVRLKFNC